MSDVVSRRHVLVDAVNRIVARCECYDALVVLSTALAFLMTERIPPAEQASALAAIDRAVRRCMRERGL